MVEQVINLLHTRYAKDLAENLVKTIPKYWYHAPASSTGKYHPSYALGDGGLMRHTIAACMILNHLFVAANEFDEHEQDMMMIAMLMHDSRKSGSQEEYEKDALTKFEHPLLAADVVLHIDNYDYETNDYKFNPKDLEFIAHCIKSHMGKWTTSKYSDTILDTPVDKYQKMVHMADYLASRKDIEYIF